MGTQLRIYWDGQTPGLKDGRLSIASFGPALQALLKAARNIARHQVAAATGEEDYDTERGTRSTLVDLQLSTYESGSAQPTLDVVPMPSSFGAFQAMGDLPDRVTEELFTSIEQESTGKRRNRFINEYLHSLPKDVAVQRYSILKNGTEVKTFSVTSRELMLLDPVGDYPRVVMLRGKVDAVNFGEWSAPRVKFIPMKGRPFSASATEEQVQQAIRVRENAKALFVMGEAPRVLWIRADDERVPSMSPEQRIEHIEERWGTVLERLDD